MTAPGIREDAKQLYDEFIKAGHKDYFDFKDSKSFDERMLYNLIYEVQDIYSHFVRSNYDRSAHPQKRDHMPSYEIYDKFLYRVMKTFSPEYFDRILDELKNNPVEEVKHRKSNDPFFSYVGDVEKATRKW